MPAVTASLAMLFRITIVAVLCLGLFGAAARRWAVPRAVYLAASHATACSLRETVSGVQRRLDLDHRRRDVESTVQRVRQEERLELWNTPLGEFWNPAGNDLPFLLAEQMRGDYESGSVVLRHGDIILDCGANVGLFTRRALLRGAALVVAVEPSPANEDCLRRTFARDIADGRVIVYPKGLWYRDDHLEMNIFGNSALDSFVLSVRPETALTPRKVRLPLTTIDKLVAELNLPRIDFIKMDIEGAERNALRGAAETLRRFRPRLGLALENLPDDPVILPNLIKSLQPGYQFLPGPCEGWDFVAPHLGYFVPPSQ